MNEQVHVPRWVMVIFVGPLVLACVIAAGTTLMYIPQLQNSVERLERMQTSLASKDWVQGRMDVYSYRLNQIEKDIDDNSGRIVRNRNLIDELQNK